MNTEGIHSLVVVVTYACLGAFCAPALAERELVWEVRGPWGGYVEELIVHPDDSDVLYALLYSNSGTGVFKSLDGGKSWHNHSTGIARLWNGASVRFLAMSPHDPEVLYVGGRAGLYNSENGARTWCELPSHPDWQLVVGLSIDRVNADLLYAATASGLFRSTDGGYTWDAHVTDAGYVYDVEVDPFFVGRLYAATAAGLLVSSDSGAGWTSLSHETVYEVIVDQTTPNTLFWLTLVGGYGSWDSGSSTWLSPSKMLYPVLVDRGNPNRLFAGNTEGVYVSLDRGDNWQMYPVVASPMSNQFSPLAQSYDDLDVVYAGAGYYAPTEQSGLYVTHDGGVSWRATNQGLTGVPVFELALSGNPTRVYVKAGSSDFGVRIMDEKGGWTRLDRPAKYEFSSKHPFEASVGYAVGTGPGSIMKTEDGGLTWEDTGLRDVTSYTPKRVLVHPRFPETLYAAALSVFRSDDSGVSWRSISGGLFPIIDVAVDSHDRDIAYVALDAGGLYRTLDGGDNWESLNEHVFDGPIRVNDEGILYAATERGVWASGDRGDSWVDLTGDLPPTRIFQIVTSPTTPRGVYLATESGVYFMSEELNPLDGEHAIIPSAARLHQNYPNPFNATTTIAYTLRAAAIADLRVYNTGGQQVRHLVRKEHQAGFYQVEWDGKDDIGNELGSGVYFYRLRESSTDHIKRMVLVR